MPRLPWSAFVFAAAAVLATAGYVVSTLPAASPAPPAPPGGPVVTAESAGASPAAEPTALTWEGHLLLGPADRWAHTYELEPVVEPLAKAGFRLEVPAGTQALEMSLDWPPGTRMHLMTHGPEDAGMPTYMAGFPDTGHDCLRIPPEGIAPGTWQVMAHGDSTSVNLRFTITVDLVGPPGARILDGPHGHSMMPGRGMEMEMKEPLSCEEA